MLRLTECRSCGGLVPRGRARCPHCLGLIPTSSRFAAVIGIGSAYYLACANYGRAETYHPSDDLIEDAGGKDAGLDVGPGDEAGVPDADSEIVEPPDGGPDGGSA